MLALLSTHNGGGGAKDEQHQHLNLKNAQTESQSWSRSSPMESLTTMTSGLYRPALDAGNGSVPDYYPPSDTRDTRDGRSRGSTPPHHSASRSR
jgi:hypothetical protein